MSEALDRAVTRMLAGTTIHTEADELPPQAQELIESHRGGTFVVWNEGRPLAVVVMLPPVPAFAAEVKQELATLWKELLAEIANEGKKPRRRRS